ncbi:hypothetical protein DR64_8115 [Paraburkholderia xenovorans LB400]|uniref:Uncharacterized protein n=1 Tax=Paraburkholderia xenovorans (strain LB400) TaxID=266265 RepID=Q13I53_PARXL|nr:hypothetical protein Bxe_C0320 [Paraburkholderia xenovorans LB400]AIP35207.1 hypothetical protein DR64_8115 [Paraburkholderia xenovorans LB400]
MNDSFQLPLDKQGIYEVLSRNGQDALLCVGTHTQCSQTRWTLAIPTTYRDVMASGVSTNGPSCSTRIGSGRGRLTRPCHPMASHAALSAPVIQSIR